MARANGTRAVLIAESISVHCPACDRAQPSPDDNDLFTPEQLKEASGRDFTCVDCDHEFVLNIEHKVNLP